MQQIKSNNVDLPLPEGPIIPIVLFLGIVSSRFLKTKFSLSCLYLKLTATLALQVARCSTFSHQVLEGGSF